MRLKVDRGSRLLWCELYENYLAAETDVSGASQSMTF